MAAAPQGAGQLADADLGGVGLQLAMGVPQELDGLDVGKSQNGWFIRDNHGKSQSKMDDDWDFPTF